MEKGMGGPGALDLILDTCPCSSLTDNQQWHNTCTLANSPHDQRSEAPPSSSHQASGVHKKLAVPQLEGWHWLPNGEGKPRRWCCVQRLDKGRGLNPLAVGRQKGSKAKGKGLRKGIFYSDRHPPMASMQHCPPHMPAAASQPSFKKDERSQRRGGGWGSGSALNTAVTETNRCSGGTRVEKKHSCVPVVQLESPAWHRQGQAPAATEAWRSGTPGSLLFWVANKDPLCFPGHPCCQFVSHLPKRPNY